MTGVDWAMAAATIVVTLLSTPRWWRVAQKEHYGPGRLTAMTILWANTRLLEAVLMLAVWATVLLSVWVPWIGVLAALIWLNWPIGLPLWRQGGLVFTARLKRFAAIHLILLLVAAAALIALPWHLVVILPLLVVPTGDLALLIARPIEDRLARKWQIQAAETIRRVNPRIVAITGSYGKTSTKNYATHLIQGRWSALASPASFNNAMGLSRAVNDRLQPGTDVFIAEMGTYGPGEIKALTEIFTPEISAITTIGEAHLERMKDKTTIARAKSEILPPAKVAVLSIDDPELVALAKEYADSKRVITVSAKDPSAQVSLIGSTLSIDGAAHEVEVESDHPINVAVAVGIALALDVPIETILARISSIPGTPHRAEAHQTPEGVWVIDDTFNSNPTGAAAALHKAVVLAGETGRVWTITPGMVELGREQAGRNSDFAMAATATPRMRLAVVGWTNRKALVIADPARTLTFGSRAAAQRHVLELVQPGDVVLYENDLPDHYP